MVELLVPNQMTRVRFPSAAPLPLRPPSFVPPAPPAPSLDAWLADLRRRRGPVPGLDPHGPGANARLLILLETPGRTMDGASVVTLDAPTGTARNLSRWLDEAGIERADALVWNAVPWVIHAPGARTRAPRRTEIEAGVAELPGLLAHLPALRAVVLSGRAAARAADAVRASTDAPVLEMAHPSPVYVNTDPAIAERCRATLRAAARALR